MFRILTLNEDKKWDEIIRSMCEYDFYHLSAYHRLDKSGEALLFYFQNDSDAFAFPFLLRCIENTNYKDITSIYGYGGPLSRNKIPSPRSIELFRDELMKYLDEQNIVSVFSTLHPILTTQSVLIEELGETVFGNTTVAIDLKLPSREQRKQYARSTKYRINRLNRAGFYVKEASENKEIEAFIRIYKENMDRVKADSKYYFADDYFYSFLKTIDSAILLAYHENEITSGSLCTYCNSIMQAHLNATSNRYLQASPLKLVLDAARKKGMEKKMSWLHLGGGRASTDDSLFQFKSRFSHEHFSFRMWKYIHNREAYRELLYAKYGETPPESSFFPLYRG